MAAFRPDIILSDYHLPGFSGREALEIAQELHPDIPFIIWSGVLGDEAAVELIKQGATDYVLKDRPARLPSVILRALAEVEQRARLANLEDQLMQAQRLASLGQLAAAEQAMTRIRQLLTAARGEAKSHRTPILRAPGHGDTVKGTGYAHGGTRHVVTIRASYPGSTSYRPSSAAAALPRFR